MNAERLAEQLLPELLLVALEENHSVDMFDGVEVGVIENCQVIAVWVMSK